MSQNIFNKDLVAIFKSEVTLTLKKAANVGMSKLLMYKFYYDLNIMMIQSD